MLALVAIKLPIAVLGLAAGLFPVAITAWLLVFGVRGIGHLGDRFYVGPWALGPLTGLLLCALAIAAGILAIAALEGLRSLLASLSRALLSPAEQPAGPVREMLAESLGDRTLSVAYWLPERRIFVDEAGHMVRLPEPGSGRAWTAVERDGRRVAAIIHDAELDTGPELVNAAAAGAALAIDNERLKADLRARVEELRLSRVRIVEATDHARRRIERDLHDGAQQQLVSLSLDLRLLKAKLNGNEVAAATVDQLSEKLATALAELRELARGIHPVILTERGLVPAVAALAQRAPVPVEADISIHERLTPAIEAAAYFVVAEALTNVAKYAQAENVLVDLRRDDANVVVVVEDDGVGGADLETRHRPARARRPPVRARRDARGRDAAGRRHAPARADPVHAGRRDLRSEPTRTRRRRDEAARPARAAGPVQSPAAARSPRSASPTSSRARASSPRRSPTSARRAAGARCGSRSSPTPRRRARSGRSCATASTPPRARWTPRSPTSRPTSSRSRACASSSTRRSTPSPTGSWSRSPDPLSGPRSGARCAPASRSCRSTPGPTCGAELGILAHVGQPEAQAGRERRRAARSGRRAQRDLHQPGRSRNKALGIRCAAFARAMRKAGGRSRVFALDVEDRNVAAPKLAAEIERRKADGVLGLGTGGAAAALDAKKLGGRAARVKIGTFDLTPEVLEAIKDGRILFAVDQQAYLQGYMPIVMLTQEARFGLFPSRGEVVATGPNFVTRETAPLALELSWRGIR